MVGTGNQDKKFGARAKASIKYAHIPSMRDIHIHTTQSTFEHGVLMKGILYEPACVMAAFCFPPHDIREREEGESVDMWKHNECLTRQEASLVWRLMRSEARETRHLLSKGPRSPAREPRADFRSYTCVSLVHSVEVTHRSDKVDPSKTSKGRAIFCTSQPAAHRPVL